jgi:hypothetical protein
MGYVFETLVEELEHLLQNHFPHRRGKPSVIAE